MTSRILKQFKQRLSSFELVPSGGGCFEIELDDEMLYSKLATGSFPDEEAIVRMVGERLK